MGAAITLLTALLVFGAFIYTISEGIVLLFTSNNSLNRILNSFNTQNNSVDLFLRTNFSYYRTLPENAKSKFLYRVNKFINNKNFEGRKELEVTNEMKILISASAVQVTFGLEKFLFDSFHTILLYPEKYYSTIDKRYHKGEVNLAGTIVFSWKDFKEGYAVAGDNYNLGLHEMAHALRFDKFKNSDVDEFFSEYFNKWQAIGNHEFYRIKAGKESFLREYAGSNKEEFFAVCVEHFFESAQKMREVLPELYKHMCVLLNQDPLNENKSETPVREQIFHNNVQHKPGRAIFESPLTYSKLIFPFIFLLLFLSFLFINSVNENGFSDGGSKILSILITGFIASGGFTISKRFKKIKLHENGISIIYSLNPVLKDKFYGYDNIISFNLHEGYYWDERNYYNDTLEIIYTNGIDVKRESFTLDNMPVDYVENIAAYIKNNGVLIKVFGKKWSHESILNYQQKLK